MEVVEHCAALGSLLQGETIQNVATGMDIQSYRVPLGVCGGIAPFNFPVMIPLWMFPMSITCGNTYIMKPSERVAGSSVKLMQLLEATGIPKGVVNLVNGDKTIVDSMLDHSDIKSISFVGSTDIAKYIYSRGCANGKRVQSNGGAKNHCIVMPDYNLEAASSAILGAAFGASGQRCMALSVTVLVGDAKNALPLVMEKAKNLKISAGWENPDLGPLINPSQPKRITEWLDAAEKKGAKILLDGRNYTNEKYPNGNFFGPTIVELNSSNYMNNEAYTCELFGPVLTVVCVDTYEEALEIVNSNEYGNGTSIFTRSGFYARDFVNRAEPGQVGVNVPIPVPLPMFSFTGNKSNHHNPQTQSSET